MKNHKLPTPHSILLALVFASIPWLSCQAMPPLDLSNPPTPPDYATPEGWLSKPATPTAGVDIFFVYPTVMFNDTDWVMDTSRSDMRALAMRSIDEQASVFKGQANIYAPMYRQMNMAGLSLSDADAAPLNKIVHSDVWRALKYYLKYENNGRPFFLAGHSQGSMILTDIMFEHWGSMGVEDRMVASLLIGWSITPDDLATNPSVRMCESSDQIGCVISYNTMAAGRQPVAPTLKKGALAVNPLSWRTDGTMIPAHKNLGAVFFDAAGKPAIYPYFTTAQIVDGGLIVVPDNVDLVTIKGGEFPQGVYHAFDYALFYENLKANIAERIDAFARIATQRQEAAVANPIPEDQKDGNGSKDGNESSVE